MDIAVSLWQDARDFVGVLPFTFLQMIIVTICSHLMLACITLIF